MTGFEIAEQTQKVSQTNPPAPAFGVYIHWPFCAAKCPYCDFNSHVRHKGWDERRFLAAYLKELDHVAKAIGPQQVDSVFFGGGTPSLMQPETAATILDRIAFHWTVRPGAEITLEANPGSVEAQRFKSFASAGVNRVSIGVQSLKDEQLQKLGRIHTVAEAKAAIVIARETFSRFSFDLIYARPGQSLADWETELCEALSLASTHLSLYQLTIEPDTPFEALFHAGRLAIPDGEHAAQLYELTTQLTRDAGLPVYEVSNYAAPGDESQHNLLYWRYGAYAGIGPGAHGRLAVDGTRIATSTQKHPETWASLVESDGHGFTEWTYLNQRQIADEMLLMGLRIREGLDVARLERLTGFTIENTILAELDDLGLAAPAGNTRIAATDAGMRVLDSVIEKLSSNLKFAT